MTNSTNLDNTRCINDTARNELKDAENAQETQNIQIDDDEDMRYLASLLNEDISYNSSDEDDDFPFGGWLSGFICITLFWLAGATLMVGIGWIGVKIFQFISGLF